MDTVHQFSDEDVPQPDYESEGEAGPLLTNEQMIESDSNHNADTPIYEEADDDEDEYVIQPLDDGPSGASTTVHHLDEVYVGERLEDEEDEGAGFGFKYMLLWLVVGFLLLAAIHMSCHCVPPFLFLAEGVAYMIYALTLAIYRMIKNKHVLTRYTVVALVYLLSGVFVVTVLLAAWAAERTPFYGPLYATFSFLLPVALLESWTRFSHACQQKEHWTARDPVVVMAETELPPAPEDVAQEEMGRAPKRRAAEEELF